MERMSDSLIGRTALITGGARRLGRAAAMALAARGVRLVIHYNKSSADAHSLVEGLHDYGVEAWAIQADLKDTSDVERLVDHAVASAGTPVDILVNNASIFPEKKLDMSDPDEILESVGVHALAPMLLARRFAAQTDFGLEHGHPCIVNMLDTRITCYDHQHVPYHLGKRLLFDLTKIMALEYAPRIRVNGIAPGLILPPEGQDEEYLERLAETNPLQDHGDPKDVADALLYLVLAEFVTGQVLYVDGGRHLKGNLYV